MGKGFNVVAGLLVLAGTGFAWAGNEVQPASAAEQRIAECLSARDPDCLLQAAAALVANGMDASTAYSLAHAQMFADDRAGVRSTLPYVHPAARLRIVAALAGNYWADGDTDAAMDSLRLLNRDSDRAKLLAAIGVAQFRAGDTTGGHLTIEAAEAAARRAPDLWQLQSGMLPVVNARAAIGDQAAATALLTHLYRTARNGGADRTILYPLELTFIAFGDIAGTREVLANTRDGDVRVRHLIGLARALADRGEGRSAEKFLQQAVAIIGDPNAYGDRFRLGRVVSLRSIARVQAGMGKPEDAVSTLQASLRVAERIRREFDPTIDEPDASFERDMTISSTVESLIMLAEIGGEEMRYAEAVASANRTERTFSRIELLRRIGTSMADHGDGPGARTVFEEAFAIAKDYARETGDYLSHLELAGAAEAAGFERLSDSILQDVTLLTRSSVEQSADPLLLGFVAEQQSAAGDADGVLATLQRMHAMSLEHPDDEFDIEAIARTAAYYAAALARLGYLDGAYRVAEFGVGMALAIPDPAKRAAALVELALAPAHHSYNLRSELPFDDIVSPSYPPI